VKIPEKLDGLTVTYIDGAFIDWVFKDKNIEAVLISNTVTGIGDGAFSGYHVLTNIPIPANVTSIGSYAFSNCTGLTSMTLPGSVTSIGASAFSYCAKLTSVTIPASVTSIGDSAFYGCANLSAITVDAANTAFFVQDGVLYDKPTTRIVAVPRKLAGAVTIPNGITSIEDYAFSDCAGLTSITIPNSVTSIGFDAFSGFAGLTSVTIPNGVTSIGSGAFSYCTKLTSVTIPTSVTTIGDNAFSGCAGMTSLTIPVGLVPAGGSSIFPSGFERIVSGYESLAVVLTGNGGVGFLAFYNCAGLTSVTIGSGVTSIGYYAFEGCTGLTSVTFEGSGTAVDVASWGETFPYLSSLLSAGDATYDNGFKMSAGTYTREPDGEVWTKQP
jgi:hypothetical protein